MNDAELLREFVRVERTHEKVEIQILTIRWDGPHTPVSTWEVVTSLPNTADEPAIEKATAGLLQDHRYFLTCMECSQRKPVGSMLNGSTCQQCAQEKHGIVF